MRPASRQGRARFMRTRTCLKGVALSVHGRVVLNCRNAGHSTPVRFTSFAPATHPVTAQFNNLDRTLLTGTPVDASHESTIKQSRGTIPFLFLHTLRLTYSDYTVPEILTLWNGDALYVLHRDVTPLLISEKTGCGDLNKLYCYRFVIKFIRAHVQHRLSNQALKRNCCSCGA